MATVYGTKKAPLGFIQVDPLPTQEELERFYREQYFQTANSNTNSYDQEYLPEEMTYFENRGRVCESIWQEMVGERKGTYLDVGCGEGFLVDYFHNHEWQVECCDFSAFGITKHNPHLLPYFSQGDIFQFLENKIARQEVYDLINLANVLEHVRNPLDLLKSLKRLVRKGGLIRILVPNDYSPLQQLLVEKGLTDETWFGPPDHLAYFTFESLGHVLKQLGFKIIKMMADFPIEMFLFNQHSNYWADRSKGKEAHLTRICIDNFLVDQGIEPYIKYMEAAAGCCFGRCVHAYISV